MNKFRLIMDPPLSAAMNMAKDLALLESQSVGQEAPALRIYRWASPSVTLGYFQKHDKTVNMEYCRDNGISVTRRVTAGGAVLHDCELTYSFTVPLNSRIVPPSVEDSFREIIAPLISVLRSLSLEAEYRPVNDIIIKGRKVSGSAQARKRGALQQHGTLILDISRETLSHALKADTEKLQSRGFKTSGDAVTSLCGELGMEFSEDYASMLAGKITSEFAGAFDISFTPAGLSMAETDVMNSYIKKFTSDDWNLRSDRKS